MASIHDIIGPEPFNRRYLTCKASNGNTFRANYPEEFKRSKRRKFVKVHRVTFLEYNVDEYEILQADSLARFHASFNEMDDENLMSFVCIADGTLVNKFYEVFSNKPYFEYFFTYNFSDPFTKIKLGYTENPNGVALRYEAVVELELFY